LRHGGRLPRCGMPVGVADDGGGWKQAQVTRCLAPQRRKSVPSSRGAEATAHARVDGLRAVGRQTHRRTDGAEERTGSNVPDPPGYSLRVIVVRELLGQWTNL
ncbi:hypothetical protein BC834DRAFT_887256, partial [Gloeopeniophorella convolvens]